MFRQVPHQRKVRLHPKVWGYSQLRGNLKAGWEEIRNPTQRRVLNHDCKMHTLAGWWTQPRGSLSLQKRNQEMWTFPNLKLGVKKMWQGDRLLAKQLLGNPVHPANQTAREVQKLKRKKRSHNLHVSPATVHHTEAVFSIVRKIYGREHDDPLDDLDVNMAILGIFLNATLRAEVHLGQDYEANSRFVKDHIWESVGQLFNEAGKLISEQKKHCCKHN